MADPTDPDDQAASDDAYYRQALHEFIDIAVALAQPLPSDATLPPGERAEALERIGRTLRRTIILARHIAEHKPPLPAVQRTLARKRIIRAVDETLANYEDGPEAEALRAEVCERLDTPDLEHDITHRPIDEIIREIRRDLGLANVPGAQRWPRRTPDNLASLAALAAAPTGQTAPLYAASRCPHPEPDPEPEPEKPDESLLAYLLRREPVRDG